ncbi:MAG TPA: ATP synthase F1 subunit delta [Candidatus Limnocylindria bacterium]|nr:ATP synthase F1 subunit delta [Candidatus Limnocylindria bacterium]
MSATAQRYAAALADVAMEHRSAETVKRDLAAFVELFFTSTDLRNALESPAVNREVKVKVITTIAGKMGLNEAVQNFICLVVDHRRTEMLREMVEAFGEELNKRLGIEEAEVTSARELSVAEKKVLTGVLERRTGKKIEARFREDSALLGGAIVRLGSTIYDGSVREQLNRLRERLEAE